MRCPACHAENPPAALWCASCGAALPASSAEHRLVTVLYADLVGHAAIQSRVDPEEWWRFLQAYVAELAQPVHRYGGTVEKFIGDAVFAVFGIPQTHEDDALRAAHAAVEMHAAMDGLNASYATRLGGPVGLRIGVSTGEAIAPRPADGEHLVIGDLTNLAERLQSAAPPDSIFLSERTYALIAPLVEADAVGPLVLKGIPGESPAYLLRSIRPGTAVARGIGITVPLVDREPELELLWQTGQLLLAGQGQIVTVIGEAGVGKSRLVSELLARLRPAGLVLEARCHEFTQDTAYGGVVQHLRGYLQLSETDPPDVVRDHLAAALQRLFSEPVPEVRGIVEHLVAPDLAGQFADRIRGLDPDEVRRLIIRAVVSLWEQVASRGPVVLLIEDLHWTDSSSAVTLDEIAGLTDRLPVMVLCTLRPERRSPAWEFKFRAERDHPHHYQELRLRSLSPGHTEELAQALLAQAGLAVDLTKAIALRSEGNPFFVEEMVRSLRERGALPAAGRLPDTLQGVLQTRLDTLTQPARRVLQTAAVVGRTFSLRLLQAVQGPEAELGAQMAELQRGEFVTEHQLLPELQLSFRHGLLQEAAYAALLSSDRRAIHRRVGEVMAQELPGDANLPMVFHHFAAGEAWAEAVEYGARAAAWAGGVGAPGEALAHYHQVVDVLEGHADAAPVETHRHVREAYGDLLVLVGRFDEARVQYQALGAAARGAREVAHAERKLGSAYRQEGRLDRAIEHLRDALLALPSDEDPVEEAWLHLDLGYVEDLIGGDPGSVLAHCERAKTLASGRDPILNARVHRLFAIAYTHLGTLDAAQGHAVSAAQFASQGNDPLEVANAHNNLAHIHLQKGELDMALRQVEEGLAVAEEGLAAAGWAERTRAIRGLAILHMTKGELFLDRGQVDEARRALEEAQRNLEEAGSAPRVRVDLLADLAQALTAQGAHEQAMTVLGEAQQLCAAYPLHRLVPRLTWIRAEVSAHLGDLIRAEEICAEGLSAVERYGATGERAPLLRVRASVARESGRLEDALRWLGEATALLEPHGRTVELGRVYLERGKALLATDRDSASHALRRARECFVGLGAQAYVDMVDGVLKGLN